MAKTTENEHTAALRKVKLFAGVSDADLNAIASRARVVEHRAGHTLVSEGGGSGGGGFHMLLDGKATVSVGGHPRRTLGPGDYYGEISLIDGKPRSATIKADTDVKTLSLVSWEFTPLLDERSSLTRALLMGMCERVRDLEQRLAGQS